MIMSSRICVCCGDAIAEDDNQPSRNPNVCFSCSILEGLEESRAADSDPERLAGEAAPPNSGLNPPMAGASHRRTRPEQQ